MSDYLIHHGVKGMKWGVRRYQNKDGTLTKRGMRLQEKEAREKARDNMSKTIKENRSTAKTEFERSKIDRDSKILEKGYVKKQTIGNAALAALLVSPFAASQLYKAAKDVGLSGRQATQAALATGLGTTALTTLYAHADAKYHVNRVSKEYGV